MNHLVISMKLMEIKILKLVELSYLQKNNETPIFN